MEEAKNAEAIFSAAEVDRENNRVAAQANRDFKNKNSERIYLNQFDGKYATLDFRALELIKSSADIISEIYKDIVAFANRNDLKIINISRIEDDHLKGVTVAVIFEKPQEQLEYLE